MHCETKLDFSIGWALGSIYQILKEKSVPMGFSNNRGIIGYKDFTYSICSNRNPLALCCAVFSILYLSV